MFEVLQFEIKLARISHPKVQLYNVIIFVSVSPKFGTCHVVRVNGTLVVAKLCTFTLECIVRILSSTSIPFTLMTVHVANLAQVETKWIKVCRNSNASRHFNDWKLTVASYLLSYPIKYNYANFSRFISEKKASVLMYFLATIFYTSILSTLFKNLFLGAETQQDSHVQSDDHCSGK
jgi:hypothetical protein